VELHHESIMFVKRLPFGLCNHEMLLVQNCIA